MKYKQTRDNFYYFFLKKKSRLKKHVEICALNGAIPFHEVHQVLKSCKIGGMRVDGGKKKI